MKKMNKSNVLGILYSSLFIFALVAILIGCTTQGMNRTDKPQPIATGLAVDGLIVKTKQLKEELEVAGTVVANQEVDITSELTRKVVHVHVREGNFVKAGTLLFQLDAEDLQARLEQLNQQEKLAALHESRLKDLIEHDAAVQQDYDVASTNLKVLQAEVRQLQATIDKTEIRAPFDGHIGIINTYKGALVSPDKMLTKIVDDAQVKIEFTVPEKYASMIAIGSKQEFSVVSDAKTYTATVTAKASHLDETTRTLLIRAISANQERQLLTGQSARLRLTIHTEDNALMVASQALIPSSQGYSVFVAHNNKAELAQVEIGQRGPYDIQVIKGVSVGDTVITSNLPRLTPGTEVLFATVK